MLALLGVLAVCGQNSAEVVEADGSQLVLQEVEVLLQGARGATRVSARALEAVVVLIQLLLACQGLEYQGRAQCSAG